MDESKTFKTFTQSAAGNPRSLKIKKENERVLYMKSKPRSAQKTFDSERKITAKKERIQMIEQKMERSNARKAPKSFGQSKRGSGGSGSSRGGSYSRGGSRGSGRR